MKTTIDYSDFKQQIKETIVYELVKEMEQTPLTDHQALERFETNMGTKEMEKMIVESYPNGQIPVEKMQPLKNIFQPLIRMSIRVGILTNL
ncbi:hypothetical protein [Vagococcus fluvialis]|uniref:hypothetical protein n=1 Tax=Vagococcus fluvialis TaxID=2738 RepID=UPI0037B55B05